MTQVFFFEAFAEEQAALEKFAAGALQAQYSWKSIQEWGDSAVPPAPIISVRTQSLIPTHWAEHLQAILTRSTGFDHLLRYKEKVADCPACAYLPLYCHRAVAEQALLLWAALMRKLPTQMRQFASFNRDGLTGQEIMGKRLLVIGVGKIGSEIVAIGRGLGMQVRGVDPVRQCSDLEYISFAEGAAWADVVAVAMSLNEDNYGFFNTERLACLKPGAILVNVARGEFTPLAELAAALRSGRLGAVGLDVFEDETSLGPLLRAAGDKTDNLPLQELQQSEQVIMTPHNAFNTAEAVERKAEQSIQQIEAFLKSGKFIWPVNF